MLPKLVNGSPYGLGLGEGELLLLVLLPLPPLLGLRLLESFLAPLRGLGESEDDEDLPRLCARFRPLRGETDLECERAGLRIGERLCLRYLLKGLRSRLGGERRLIGKGERLRTGLPRIRKGDLWRRGAGDLERRLAGESCLLLGGLPPRRGEPVRGRGDSPLRRATGDFLRNGERGF